MQPDPAAFCRNGQCPSGQTCDTKSNLCFRYAPPVVTLSSPAGDVPIDAGAAAVEGSYSEPEGAVISLAYSFDQTVWNEVAFDAGSYAFFALIPPLDAQTATLSVRATDVYQQSGMAQVRLEVDNVPPDCRALDPQSAQVLNLSAGPNYVVRVAMGDGSGKVLNAALQIDDGGFRSMTLDGGVATSVWRLDPADDGVSHLLTWRAGDPLGNECFGLETVVVDQVSPSISLSPGEGVRNGALQLQATFSESIVAAGPPVSLTPPVDGGHWASSTLFVVPLAPDTTYMAQVPALSVRDSAGNPNIAGVSSTFRTQVASLPSGTTIASGVLTFDAASDQDGVLSIAYVDSSRIGHWFAADPITGLLVDVTGQSSVLGGPFPRLQAFAWADIQADLSAQRVRGYSLTLGDGGYASAWRLDPGGATIPLPAALLVPTPPGGYEGVANPIGQVQGGAYSRGPFTAAINIRPDRLVYAGAGDWAVIQDAYPIGTSADVVFQPFGCDSRTGGCGSGPPGSNRPMPEPADGGRLSATGLRSCGVPTDTCFETCVVADGVDGGRTLACGSISGYGVGLIWTETSSAAESLTIGPTWSGTTMLGARLKSTGIELLQRDEALGTQGAWAVLGTAPNSVGARQFQPVMFATRPGLVWLDAAGNLKTYVP